MRFTNLQVRDWKGKSWEQPDRPTKLTKSLGLAVVSVGAPHSEYFPRIFLGFTTVYELQLGIGNIFYILKLTKISNAVSFSYLGCSLQPAASCCWVSSSQNLKVSKVYVPELQKVTMAAFSVLEDLGRRKRDFRLENSWIHSIPCEGCSELSSCR